MRQLAVLFAAILGVFTIKAQGYYDFSAVCPSGQTLYYTITSSSTSGKSTVKVSNPYTAPGHPFDLYLAAYPLSGSLQIPETVVYNNITYDVTGLDVFAFYGQYALTDIIIPPTVTEAGDYAFEQCTSLTHMTLPRSLQKIGYRCFAKDSSLVSVLVQTDSLDEAGGDVFLDCPLLDTATIDTNVRYLAPLFRNCTSIKTAVILADSLNYAWECFAYTPALDEADFAYNVRTIPASMFSHTPSLRHITLPDSLEMLEDEAFAYSGLKEVTIPGNVRYFGRDVFCHSDSLQKVTYNAVDCPDLMYNSPFRNCAIFSVLDIGSDVQRIPAYMFNQCNAITDVYIPAGVRHLGQDAFRQCSALRSVSIGSNVTQINSKAFYMCQALQKITVRQTEPCPLDATAFTGVDSATAVFIPCGSLDNYQNAGNWDRFSNFTEDFVAEWSFTAADTLKGSVTVLQEPSCQQDAIIKAVPETGFYFSRWSDGNNENPRTIAVSEDTHIKAYFSDDVHINTCTDAALDFSVRTDGGNIILANTCGRLLTITDALGRILYREKAADNRAYPVPAAGIYFVSLQGMPARKVFVGIR